MSLNLTMMLDKASAILRIFICVIGLLFSVLIALLGVYNVRHRAADVMHAAKIMLEAKEKD